MIWETSLEETGAYDQAIALLFEGFEKETGTRIAPGERAKVGLKLNTRSGRGLATPLPLIRAVIAELEMRGFSRQSILLIDSNRHALHRAGVLSFSTLESDLFEGCPVLALDSGQYFDEDWFYDSPLPPTLRENPNSFFRMETDRGSLDVGDRQRKSFLPMPLIEDVDFWINLATVVDDPALGIDGAMASATLWNVGNSQRFLANDATAAAALAEIAAIPELRERLLFHCVSLGRYQYIGGPMFHSRYTQSEPKIWLGSDAVAIDRLFLERMNRLRVLEGFPRMDPLPRQFPFAVSLGLGTDDLNHIEVRSILSENDSNRDSVFPDLRGTDE
ncbi:MAG: DUF362 domain-containing protein [Coraliomargaritaceae bacterium]